MSEPSKRKSISFNCEIDIEKQGEGVSLREFQKQKNTSNDEKS